MVVRRRKERRKTGTSQEYGLHDEYTPQSGCDLGVRMLLFGGASLGQIDQLHLLNPTILLNFQEIHFFNSVSPKNLPVALNSFSQC